MTSVSVQPELEDYVLRRVVEATSLTDLRFGPRYLPQSFARDAFSHQSLRTDATHVVAAVWGLIGRGLLFLETSDSRGPEYWRVLATARGRQQIEGGPMEPLAWVRWMQRLKSEAPNLDEATERYAREALTAFGANCYLAAVVMIGVAAESVFLRLASALAVAVDGPAARKLLADLDRPGVPQQRRFEAFRKLLEPHRKALHTDLADPLHLDAVADLLRQGRNNAGHPTNTEVDEHTARDALTLGGRYLINMLTLLADLEDRAVGSLGTSGDHGT